MRRLVSRLRIVLRRRCAGARPRARPATRRRCRCRRPLVESMSFSRRRRRPASSRCRARRSRRSAPRASPSSTCRKASASSSSPNADGSFTSPAVPRQRRRLHRHLVRPRQRQRRSLHHAARRRAAHRLRLPLSRHRSSRPSPATAVPCPPESLHLPDCGGGSYPLPLLLVVEDFEELYELYSDFLAGVGYAVAGTSTTASRPSTRRAA